MKNCSNWLKSPWGHKVDSRTAGGTIYTDTNAFFWKGSNVSSVGPQDAKEWYKPTRLTTLIILTVIVGIIIFIKYKKK